MNLDSSGIEPSFLVARFLKNRNCEPRFLRNRPTSNGERPAKEGSLHSAFSVSSSGLVAADRQRWLLWWSSQLLRRLRETSYKKCYLDLFRSEVQITETSRRSSDLISGIHCNMIEYDTITQPTKPKAFF